MKQAEVYYKVARHFLCGVTPYILFSGSQTSFAKVSKKQDVLLLLVILSAFSALALSVGVNVVTFAQNKTFTFLFFFRSQESAVHRLAAMMRQDVLVYLLFVCGVLPAGKKQVQQ